MQKSHFGIPIPMFLQKSHIFTPPNHSKNRNPREIPCLLCDINILQAQCAGLEPTMRINARPDSNRLQYRYWNTAKLTRCTRSKATKRIGIFSSVLSELLLLYFLLTACLLCVYFITTRILLLKNTQDLPLGLQESNPRQPGYKPCLLPLN